MIDANIAKIPKLQLDLKFDNVHILQILTLALAVKKMSNILSDPFPVLDSTNSAPDANTNGRPLSLAIARANNVFPVPGGPLIRIPCQDTDAPSLEAKNFPFARITFLYPSEAMSSRETNHKTARKI